MRLQQCKGSWTLAELLLISSAEVERKDETGATALTKPAGGGHVAMLEWLLEARATVDVASQGGFDLSGKMAVHV